MRRLLNTLYVTTPESYLACEGETVVVKVNNEIRFRVPVHNLEGIICFGYMGASPGLMELCCNRGVALTFLTEHGRFMGRVTGKISGNVLLRRTQYRWADDHVQSLRLAKRFIQAKVFNSRVVLQRALRDHEIISQKEPLEHTIKWLAGISDRLERAADMDKVRGIEGEAAQHYFNCFNHLIVTQKETFKMNGRVRRPPTDKVNALLSFVYVLLAHEVAAALESVGLDPQTGYLHSARPGRSSLALDVMEELRPYFADRLVLSLINRRQIDEKGFESKENGAVLMTDETRKTVLTAWQKRKQEEIKHPFLKESIPIGLIPYVQSLLLARHLRGDLDDYPPFFWH